MVDDRVGLTISDPRGNTLRLADDEPDAGNVPGDLTISSALPGGAKELSTELLRDLRIAHPELEALNEVRAYGPGNRTLWQGYLSRGPENAGVVSPTAVGDAARLSDNPGLRMIVVDRDLANWTGVPRARELQQRTAGTLNLVDASVAEDAAAAAALQFTAEAPWAAGAGAAPRAAAWYDAGQGLRIARIWTSWLRDVSIAAGGAAWYGALNGADSDDALTGYAGSGNLYGGSSPTDWTLPTPRRFVFIEQVWAANTVNANDGLTYASYWIPTVYGDHGIPLFDRGDGGPPGVHGGDVLKAILDLADCGIGYSSDSIGADDYLIPDLKWREIVNASTMVLDTNRFYQRNWLVRNRLLNWRYDDELGRTWHVRRDEGIRPETLGFDESLVYNGAIVTYTDAAGTSRVVGPPASGLVGPLGLPTSPLADSDEGNPANAWGRRKWLVVDAGTSTEDGAIRLGAFALSLLADRRSAGQVEIPNFAIFDEAGCRYPASELTAGDRLLVEDQADSTPRLVVEASWSKSSRTASVTLDAPPETLQGILERLSVELVGVVS